MVDQNTDAQDWLPFVASVASRFFCTGAERDELIQSGAVGLMKAMKRFDGENRTAFASYAFKYIEGEIRSYLRNNRLIVVPRNMFKEMRRLKSIMYSEKEGGGERIKVSDAAKRLSVSEAEIVSLIMLMDGVQSIAQVCDDGRERPIAGVQTEETLVDGIELRSAIERLPEFEKAVVKLRFLRGNSQAETARILKISQPAVSKTESRAIKKLRSVLCDEDRAE
ncbi:MAG: sigma-70 family RNA polymerase sigma factor [Clostridia bacterium]|nr:sigma-70 family RNA polymerase sigma factor [Clostridia bacterium]